MNAPTTARSQQHIFRKLLKHRSATIGASIILFFIVVAIFAPLIATHDPRQANIVERLQGGSASHYLGTDKVGRDIFSRIIYGTRISLKVGFIAYDLFCRVWHIIWGNWRVTMVEDLTTSSCA